MGNVQIAVQILTTILPEQSGYMGPMPRCPPVLQKISQIAIAEGTLFCIPEFFFYCDFQVFTFLTLKLKPDDIFINKKVVHL